MHLGVFDRQARLRGDPHQHLEIVIAKATALVERIDLDDAEHPVFAIQQRGAHDGTNAKVGQRLTHLEPLIASGVGRKHRFLGVHDFVDHRTADPHRFVPIRPAKPLRLGDQISLLVAENHKCAIRLKKDLKQTVQRAGQHVVQRERAAHVAGNFEHRLQLGLR